MKKVNQHVFFYLMVKAAICIFIPLLVYLVMSLYLGFKVYNLVDSSFQSKGADYEKYAECIGRINYQRLDYSNGNNEKWVVNYHTFPIALHSFKTAKAEYKYSIKGNSIGGKDIPVTVYMELRNGKWYITGISEPY